MRTFAFRELHSNCTTVSESDFIPWNSTAASSDIERWHNQHHSPILHVRESIKKSRPGTKRRDEIGIYQKHLQQTSESLRDEWRRGAAHEWWKLDRERCCAEHSQDRLRQRSEQDGW
jgi:hypothetical protein